MLTISMFFKDRMARTLQKWLSANRLLQVNNFIALAEGKPSSEENRPLNAYFCHREVSYGVSEMMGVWRRGRRIGIAQLKTCTDSSAPLDAGPNTTQWHRRLLSGGGLNMNLRLPYPLFFTEASEAKNVRLVETDYPNSLPARRCPSSSTTRGLR
jgi:hypothetical protein